MYQLKKGVLFKIRIVIVTSPGDIPAPRLPAGALLRPQFGVKAYNNEN